MHITRIWITKKEMQHTSPLITGAEGWSLPTLKESVLDASMVRVRALASAWCDGNLGLILRLWVPNSCRTSSPAKTSSMSIRMSPSCTSPSKAPLPLIDRCSEVASLEIVRDSDKTPAVSMERRLLDLISMGILSVGLGSSSPQSKWLYKTQAACSLAEVISTSEEPSPWDVAYMRAFP